MSKHLVASDGRKRYCIRYNDNPDYGPLTEPDQEWRCWAYDAQDALERFRDSSVVEDGFVAVAWALLCISEDCLSRRDQDMKWHQL